MKNFFKRRLEDILNIALFVLLFGVLATGLIFGQSYFDYNNSNDNNDKFDPKNFDYDKYKVEFDTDIVSPLKDEKPQLIYLRNADEFKLVSEINIDNIENKGVDFTLDYLQDLIDLRLSTSMPMESDTYVEPSEIGDNNFIFINAHSRMSDKKDVKSYYEIYFGKKRVGTTNQGSWNNSFKFFTYNIKKDVEYKVIAKLRESSVLSGKWLDALNKYQPNYDEKKSKLVPITITNETEDKVAFLSVIWDSSKMEYKVETGYLHKRMHSALWKAVHRYFIQDEKNH